MKRALTAVCLSMVLAAPMAHAKMDGGMSHERGMRMEKRIDEMFSQLDLTAEQKKLIEANRAKNKESRRAIMQEMKNSMKATGDELKKTDLDMAKITALHEEQKKLFNKMSDDRFKSVLEVRKILTKEQFIKFLEMMEKRVKHDNPFKEQ